jgi:hypothetical protein
MYYIKYKSKEKQEIEKGKSFGDITKRPKRREEDIGINF